MKVFFQIIRLWRFLGLAKSVVRPVGALALGEFGRGFQTGVLRRDVSLSHGGWPWSPEQNGQLATRRPQPARGARRRFRRRRFAFAARDRT